MPSCQLPVNNRLPAGQVNECSTPSPVPLVGFPVGDPEICEDIPFGGRGQRDPCAHLQAALAHHVSVQGVLREAHLLGFGQSSHGTVEVSRSSEVQQGARKLGVWHHDDVEPAMALTRARQAAHPQVLLLFSVLFVAD